MELHIDLKFPTRVRQLLYAGIVFAPSGLGLSDLSGVTLPVSKKGRLYMRLMHP